IHRLIAAEILVNFAENIAHGLKTLIKQVATGPL
ncbi:MAG: hypothetical protein RLZZ496_109, partial [Pseudomonadota bacterium]